jgi:DNA-binding IclR family transcriptional regulator
MELFTWLAKRPDAAEELQGRLGLHPRSARDFLDALVALGFLERVLEAQKPRPTCMI